jgi:hypothetical protein
MRNAIVFLFVAAFIILQGCGIAGVSKRSNSDLSAWRIAGIGTVQPAPAEKAFRVTEGKASKGLTLISPRPHGQNTVLRFKVKPERYEGVCVVLLAASDSRIGDLAIPANHDGAMGFWSEGTVQDYMFAFHTGFHQPNMYIKRNPGMTDIAQTKDTAAGQRWYDIEIGCMGARLWMKVDGKTAVEGTDPSGGLQGGYMGIRLRGPGDGTFSCLFRDVTVREK